MKRILLVLALLVLACHAHPLRAQESAENELELVRQLRAKGWNDYARLKIAELLARNDPVLNAALPLESARVSIAEARQKGPEERFKLFDDARDKLQKFILTKKGKAEGALASVELARLTSYHAQALLSRAMREEDAPSRHREARPAEAMFIQAGKDLDGAIAAIEAAINDPGNASLKKVLEEDLKQARYDVAVNVFNQGKTYLDKGDDKVNADRTGAIVKARKAFDALRKDESSQVGWLANAWLMKCAMELTDPDAVKKYHDAVYNRREDKLAQPGIQPAVRLVRYFALQDLTLPREDSETIGNNSLNVNAKKKLTSLQRLHLVEKDAEAWLKAYPSYLKTYEGQGVLFELGYAYFSEALAEKSEKVAGPNFDKAVVYFEELAKMDGDLSERARQLGMSIRFKRIDTKAELKTFDEFMMKALMIDRRAVVAASTKLDEHARKAEKVSPDDKAKQDELKAEKKKLDDDRKQRLKDVITSLNKALALTNSKTLPKKIDDALYYLSGAYLSNGDPYRGAIVAEALGRRRATTRSAEGAASAIQTYSVLQSRHPNDASLGPRLHALAEFVLSTESWSTAPVTSLAHYHLAMSANREKKAKEAIMHLAKIDKTFTDYIYTQGQLVFIAEAARESQADNKKEQEFYLAAAKAAIQRMPKLNPKTESPSVVAMYFSAKNEMPRYMYTEAMAELNAREDLKAIAKFNAMRKYVQDLQAEFAVLPGGAISKNREQIEFSMEIMAKYADLGIAEARFRGDKKERFDQVIEATSKVVGETLAKAKAVPAPEPVIMKDYRVTGDILGLALRANVQKGDVEKGKAILDVLQRLSGEKGQKGGNVVGALLNDISGQIKSMKDSKDPALAKTKDNYTAFLDVIAKEFEKKGGDTNASILLARAYGSLDLQSKAADMFGKIKAPAAIEAKIAKKKVETDEELKARTDWEELNNRHWSVQIEYIRALRACKDKGSVEKAGKVVDTMLAHKNATFKIQAMMERNYIIEDTEDKDKLQYRKAYAEWQSFLKQPAISGPNLANADVQKIYFPAYFHMTRALYRVAIFDPKIKDRPKLITGAANLIVNLELSKTKTGWEIAGPLFNQYFKDKEADQLHKEYQRLKALRTKKAMLAPVRPGIADDRNVIWAARNEFSADPAKNRGFCRAVERRRQDSFTGVCVSASRATHFRYA